MAGLKRKWKYVFFRRDYMHIATNLQQPASLECPQIQTLNKSILTYFTFLLIHVVVSRNFVLYGKRPGEGPQAVTVS